MVKKMKEIIDEETIYKLLKALGLSNLVRKFKMEKYYAQKYLLWFRHYEKRIMKEFMKLRNESKNFAEWEEKCLNFNSFKFLNEKQKKVIKLLFGNEKGWNYHIFWKMNKFVTF